MSRTLYFQQITNDRELLKERVRLLKNKLNIEGLKVEIGTPYELDFEEIVSTNGAKWVVLADKSTYDVINIKQWRVSFYIQKNTRKLTWNDVYGIVNSVNPVPYKFL